MRKKETPITQALERLNYGRPHLPGRRVDRPDQDRLATRFEDFLAASSMSTAGVPLSAVSA